MGGEEGRQVCTPSRGQTVDFGEGGGGAQRPSCLSRQAGEEGPLGDVPAVGEPGGPRVSAEVCREEAGPALPGSALGRVAGLQGASREPAGAPPTWVDRLVSSLFTCGGKRKGWVDGIQGGGAGL